MRESTSDLTDEPVVTLPRNVFQMPGWKGKLLEDYEVDELTEQAALMSDEHELIIQTLLRTGMRADELAHIQSDWANWRRGEARVQPAGDWTPKSDAGHHVILLRDPEVKRLLNQRFGKQSEIGVSQTTIWRRVTDVADETTIPKNISPHVLRHTYGDDDRERRREHPVHQANDGTHEPGDITAVYRILWTAHSRVL